MAKGRDEKVCALDAEMQLISSPSPRKGFTVKSKVQRLKLWRL